MLVALDDDPVAGGERAAGQLQLRAAQAARGAHGVACELVELGDVGAAVGEDDRGLAVFDAATSLRPAGSGSVGGGSGSDAAVLLVGGDRLLRAAVGDMVERSEFPWFGLALVVDEFDGEPAGEEGARKAPPASISGSWR